MDDAARDAAAAIGATRVCAAAPSVATVRAVEFVGAFSWSGSASEPTPPGRFRAAHFLGEHP